MKWRKRNLPDRPTTRGPTQLAIPPARDSSQARGPRGGAAQMANGPRRGKPARAVKIARTPPTNSAFTTSSTVLFLYSTVLHQHPPTSSSSPRGGPWPPQGAHRRDGTAPGDHAGLT